MSNGVELPEIPGRDLTDLNERTDRLNAFRDEQSAEFKTFRETLENDTEAAIAAGAGQLETIELRAERDRQLEERRQQMNNAERKFLDDFDDEKREQNFNTMIAGQRAVWQNSPNRPAYLDMTYDEFKQLEAEGRGLPTNAVANTGDGTADFTPTPTDIPPAETPTTTDAPAVVSSGTTQEQLNNIYNNLLGRDVDPEGLRFWTNSGLSEDEIRAAVQESAEFRQLTGTTGEGQAATREQIQAAYQDIFGREADEEGLNFWMNQGTSIDTIRNTFSNSVEGKYGKEFTTIHGRPPTDADLPIIQAYQDVLGRMPDPSGLETYSGMTLDEITEALQQSPEAQRGVAGTGSVRGLPTPKDFSRINELVASQVNNPSIPEGARQIYTQLLPNASEFIDPNNPNFIADPVTQASIVLAEASAQAIQQELEVATVDPALVGEGAAGTSQAAQGVVNPLATMEPAQGTVSVLAEAAQGQTPPEALVTNQLETLLTGIEDGNIPTWAQPAVDAVEQQLAARGISRSSVGRASLTNAIIQSAIPLASQNAQTEAQTFWKNLDNRQQTAIVNAQNLAQMDVANLNARQQAQVQNAQSFLQMDLANLQNEQQITVLDAQMRQQAYLSDQAATNAAAQFNATSQNQSDQFITSMNANIEQQNAARQTAINQFNAQQTNALNQFYTQVEAQREQFNVQNATAIEQSNVAWRRQMNQINTAGINAVNQANAMNAFNLSNQAVTFLWQEYRDQAKWEFDAGQNQANREIQLAMAAMGNEAATDSTKANAIAALGAAAFNFFGD